jgi:hypothetical protein
MRMVVKLVHPLGFPCEIDLLEEEAGDVDTLLASMLQRGYRPQSGEWPKGPGGGPLCLKHGGIEMQQRERQGDVWYSHKIVTGAGEELYCRGYPHGPKEQDGFHH